MIEIAADIEESLKNNSIEEEETKREPEKKKNLTHFISIPMNDELFKNQIQKIQDEILESLPRIHKPAFRRQDIHKVHITLSMLSLETSDLQSQAAKIFSNAKPLIEKVLNNLQLNLELCDLGVFEQKARKPKEKYRSQKRAKKENIESEKMNNSEEKIIVQEENNVEIIPEQNELTLTKSACFALKKVPTVVYLKIKEGESKNLVEQISHTLILSMIEAGIIDKKNLKNMGIHYCKVKKLYGQAPHVTLFRIKKMLQPELFNVIDFLKNHQGKHLLSYNIRRLDISTRFAEDIDKFYKPLSIMNFTMPVLTNIIKSNDEESKDQTNC